MHEPRSQKTWAMLDEQQLLYRRQFILGPRPFRPNHLWKHIDLYQGIILSVHRDLDIVAHHAEHCELVLLGYFVDPGRPNVSTLQLLQELACEGTNLKQVIQGTSALSGRWALIYHDPDALAIFHDPCGLRQVFYHRGANGLWCGSQPEIIRANTTLRPNHESKLQQFISSPMFRTTEGAWVGEKTQYRDCFHLLPNHFLDLQTGLTQRFFPQQQLASMSCEKAIEITAPLLQGSIAAIAARSRLMLAVTAGWDSRVLIAAAREHLASMYSYVDRMGMLPPNHIDVQVPLALSRKLKFHFTVENSSEDPPLQFVELLKRNVTNARMLPKTRAIFSKLGRGETAININGNGSEVCRNFFLKAGERNVFNSTTAELAARCGYPESPFVKDELEKWRGGLPNREFGFEILDMLYWEQRMGNWGAQYPAELDIAVEEFSPFNNRLILMTLLSVPTRHRLAPNYTLYARLIRHLWPEAMSVRINKPTLREQGVEAARKIFRRASCKAQSLFQ